MRFEPCPRLGERKMYFGLTSSRVGRSGWSTKSTPQLVLDTAAVDHFLISLSQQKQHLGGKLLGSERQKHVYIGNLYD